LREVSGRHSMAVQTSKSVTIVLATVIPGIALLSLLALLYFLIRRRRKSHIFNRGITPIDDDEIESWKTDRNEEKIPIPDSQTQSQYTHKTSTSVASIQKPPSVIVYQNNAIPRSSSEFAPSYLHHQKDSSVDSIQSPVLARAPNARPGLTDETVQGDEAFVPQVKRQPSRLSKHHSSTTRHGRSKSARNSVARDQWYGFDSEHHTLPPRRSAESFPRSPANNSKHKRVYSSASNPPRMSFDSEDMNLGGLSPRPLIRKSDIGRAIG
jgi:hypothetical protein